MPLRKPFFIVGADLPLLRASVGRVDHHSD
jgi:hypothetical protein